MPTTVPTLTPEDIDHLLTAPEESVLSASAPDGRIRLQPGLPESPHGVLATRTEAHDLMADEQVGLMDRPTALVQAAEILNAHNRKLNENRPGRRLFFNPAAPVRLSTCGSSIGLVVADLDGRILATDARWDVRGPEARHADPSADLGRLLETTADQAGLEITLQPRFATRIAYDACDGPRWTPAPPGAYPHQHDWSLFHATATGAPAPGWRWYTPGELAALGHRTWLHRQGRRRHPGLDAAWIGHLVCRAGGRVVKDDAPEDPDAGVCAHLFTTSD